VKIELFYTPGCEKCTDTRDDLKTAAEEVIPGVTWCELNARPRRRGDRINRIVPKDQKRTLAFTTKLVPQLLTLKPYRLIVPPWLPFEQF
jgi:hypothetical protein